MIANHPSPNEPETLNEAGERMRGTNINLKFEQHSMPLIGALGR